LFEAMPDLSPMLLYFKEAFNHDQAEKKGNDFLIIVLYCKYIIFTAPVQIGELLPYPGIEQDYDAINQKLRTVEKQLDDHLKETRKLLKYV
jgi:hypothetical protein